MDDLEEQCQEALFEVCDARERYPRQCADVLQKCIQLKNDIHMMKVSQTSKPVFERSVHFNIELNENELCFERLDDKLQDIADKLDNLKAVADQIERERTYEMNKLLRS
ncbi:uncharacterized protein LOC143368382 [Andrena cerasifolii]|uniref:uncharacterized protein LOC143368382 n=1 Tax=Andrena cerasifolii TaxID=2819439 RepID=UPI0040381A3F